MKALITLALVFALYWAGKSILGEYKSKEDKQRQAEQREKQGVGSDGLPGMAPQFEASLQAAEAQGAAALKAWLDRYRPYLRDPKLADIELDYAMMIARQKPGEARQIYQAVKRRTPQNSPIYPRVKRLEATFGR